MPAEELFCFFATLSGASSPHYENIPIDACFFAVKEAHAGAACPAMDQLHILAALHERFFPLIKNTLLLASHITHLFTGANPL